MEYWAHIPLKDWIPACAGMTENSLFRLLMRPSLLHYSNIPTFHLKLGRITQIGLDDLGMILDHLWGTFRDPLSEI
jgi:hypothetical protein